MATTTNYTFNLPTVGGNEDSWGTLLNANWTALDTLLGGVTATEIAKLDGLTVTTGEMNYLGGVKSAVQTQIDTKAPKASPVFTGEVDAGDAVTLGAWKIRDSGGTLYFQYSGNDVFKISSAGAITAENDVTAYGSV